MTSFTGTTCVKRLYMVWANIGAVKPDRILPFRTQFGKSHFLCCGIIRRELRCQWLYAHTNSSARPVKAFLLAWDGNHCALPSCVLVISRQLRSNSSCMQLPATSACQACMCLGPSLMLPAPVEASALRRAGLWQVVLTHVRGWWWSTAAGTTSLSASLCCLT